MYQPTARMLWLGIAAAGLAQAQTSSQVIDNDIVRVVQVTVAGGHKTGLHDHKMNRVMIYLDPGRQTTRYESGRTMDVSWKAGDVLWSPASGMHVAEIAAPAPVTIVEVELKQPGGGRTPFTAELDPVQVDPKHYKVEFENAQVRVLRSRLGPGESAPLHEHSLPRLVVFLTPMDVQVTTSDGQINRATRSARQVVWAPQARHEEKNMSGKGLEVVVVEFKTR